MSEGAYQTRRCGSAFVTGRRLALGIAAITVSQGACTPLADADEVLAGSEAVVIADIVFADGEGLPAGSGTARDGAVIYARACGRCHGANGEGGSAMELVGDRETITTEYPDRGIAVFWPWAPPLFDYVRRAMPPDAPGSLDADETYAVVAHLLAINGLIEPDAVIDRDTLSRLRMPNRDGFVDIDTDPVASDR